MQAEFDIKISWKNLYEYMLFFTYTSLQGLVGIFAGALMITEFVLSGKIVFLICAVAVLVYLPGSLFLRAKQQAMNPMFKKPLHYKLTQEGVEVSQEEEVQIQKWEDFYKKGATAGSILLYTTKRNAAIFPKEQLRRQKVYADVKALLAEHVTGKKG